ncbi:MAG TPA: lipocalin-like domain-containing protein [Bryobacteraceae bacterium]
MKTVSYGILALLFVSACAVSQRRSAEKTGPSDSDRERLIGAWHLASMAGPDGKPLTGGVPAGMLIYTRDGHMSVQLKYPKSASALSNEYVLNGYEASFGSFDVNEQTHTLTHHVEGSNTGDALVGKSLPRIYQFRADGHLVIRSARPDEHWSVTWEHY